MDAPCCGDLELHLCMLPMLCYAMLCYAMLCCLPGDGTVLDGDRDGDDAQLREVDKLQHQSAQV